MIRPLTWAIAAAVLLAFGSAAQAADLWIGPGARVNIPVTSMKALRDRNVVKQRFDYSCGAASLATILRYGYGDPVTEVDILTDLFNLLTEDEKAVSRREGFSLLDLKRVAEARGYRAAGFRMTPGDLPRLAGPVIVFIQPRGYKHFAVLRGTRGDRVYLADPSRGNIRMPAYRFLDDWLDDNGQGIIFVVEPKAGLPGGISPLRALPGGPSQPEIMTARELLAVGNPFLQLPELAR